MHYVQKATANVNVCNSWNVCIKVKHTVFVTGENHAIIKKNRLSAMELFRMHRDPDFRHVWIERIFILFCQVLMPFSLLLSFLPACLSVWAVCRSLLPYCEKDRPVPRWWHQKDQTDSSCLTDVSCLNTLLVPKARALCLSVFLWLSVCLSLSLSICLFLSICLSISLAHSFLLSLSLQVKVRNSNIKTMDVLN